ncbi:uncharacterized protein L969DRAFT_84827 [Mixia osmundae IAM 14324]|nr:uncharacterized protein L969DRAFT_84827 [Mixia osmundae IAM 14324]KEI42937.1 hypothetical protein L969DRAFT_84827 [Mixia osmundae IAM 14324]
MVANTANGHAKHSSQSSEHKAGSAASGNSSATTLKPARSSDRLRQRAAASKPEESDMLRSTGPRGRSIKDDEKDKLELSEAGLLASSGISETVVNGMTNGASYHSNSRLRRTSGSQTFLSAEEKDGLVAKPVEEDAGAHSITQLSVKDRQAFGLLVALYLLQGIPVGLAFGSIPYLLRAKMSYSQIGVFTLSTYPYSLKLLWSPIVDSIFHVKTGRRKSWIMPVQIIVGAILYWMGNNVSQLIEADVPNVNLLTSLFFLLVFFAATQDIAVDGWALTLLSKENLSYASTAQTVGLNTGYFLSFTVFLAFNSLDFSNKYFRSTPLDYPLLSLAAYLKFWAFGFFAVTAYLAFIQKEDPVAADDPDMDTKKVYKIMYSICKLKNVQAFVLVHLVAKLGTATNDAATSLKLLEKGLSKEDLALAVLCDFPFQIIFGYLAARWSTGKQPLKPWLAAMWARLGMAIVAMLLVHSFPHPPISTTFFLLVVSCTVGSSFASTVQFVGINAYHTQIADPLIGGTYMTLLNTVSNLGGTWPRYFVLQGIDYFTVATCHVKQEDGEIFVKATECVSDHGKAACAALGGECQTDRDGYFIVSSLCVLAGTLLLLFFIQPAARRLQALPQTAWRVRLDGGTRRL